MDGGFTIASAEDNHIMFRQNAAQELIWLEMRQMCQMVRHCQRLRSEVVTGGRSCWSRDAFVVSHKPSKRSAVIWLLKESLVHPLATDRQSVSDWPQIDLKVTAFLSSVSFDGFVRRGGDLGLAEGQEWQSGVLGSLGAHLGGGAQPELRQTAEGIQGQEGRG